MCICFIIDALIYVYWLLFIALTFLLFFKKRPVWGTVAFALGRLAKLQMLYFAPLILFELFFRYRPAQAFRSLFAGIGVGVAGWLPFAIGASNLLLPFQIYFGGFSQYKEMNLYAYNLWGLPFFSDAKTDTTVFGLQWFTYGNIGSALLFALIAAVFWVYCYTAVHKIKIPAFLTAFIYLDGVFLLTAGQHERYQVPVTILAMLCWMFFKDKKYNPALILLFLIPFINETFGIINFWLDRAEWFQISFYSWGRLIGSAVNILLFVYLLKLLKAFLTSKTVRERAMTLSKM